MIPSFQRVSLDLEKVADHFSVQHLSEADRKLIRGAKLPVTESLFDPNRDKARAAAREFLASFLMGGARHDQETANRH